MRNTREFRKNFLVNRDETGRFLVKSLLTGRCYFVEAIHQGKPNLWGDLDPATKKINNLYGKKYTGAILESESQITIENGFDNISLVKGSPFEEIQKREDILLKKKEQ